MRKYPKQAIIDTDNTIAGARIAGARIPIPTESELDLSLSTLELLSDFIFAVLVKDSVGSCVGSYAYDGLYEGGGDDGSFEGLDVGKYEGPNVGKYEGDGVVGFFVGLYVGRYEGLTVGVLEGMRVSVFY